MCGKHLLECAVSTFLKCALKNFLGVFSEISDTWKSWTDYFLIRKIKALKDAEIS